MNNLIPPDAQLIDVREPEEFKEGTLPNAVNIPLDTLPNTLDKLDKSRRIIVFCQSGVRGEEAQTFLKNQGFDCSNLPGGIDACGTSRIPTLDVRAMACPGPIVRLKREMDPLPMNAELRLIATESFETDLRRWADTAGHTLSALTVENGTLEVIIRKGSTKRESITQETKDAAAIILFSNDLDKVMAAFIIACGMAAAGSKVSIFFTFWGLSVLRKNPPPSVKKRLIDRLFGWMLPCGARKLALSKMHMAGLGTAMMKQVMKRDHVPDLPELIAQARALGVQFIACEMAMGVMGLSREEIIEIDDVAGVASFAALARDSGSTLFI